MQPISKCEKVVGIGASAGGLQSLEALFDALSPDTGMAFVVIQHLSPDFDSIMDQLLARHSAMNVVLIQDAMEIQPGNVYLLPPGQHVIISNTRLFLAGRSKNSGLSFPIDEFFRSLAQELGSNAIGVILSGTGSDGARGIRDISAAGGTVIVESLESAAFDGMPRSAWDTGYVDLVLVPHEIAKTLVRLARSEEPTPIKDDDVTMESTAIDFLEPSTRLILGLLHDGFGIDFSQYKSEMFARRVERRLKLSASDNVENYIKLLRQDVEELNQLYHDLLIGVTDFFRDKGVFERLELDVIPELVSNLSPNEDFRCWVAGAASGEEAYSLAILLAEEFERRNLEPRIRIFASDVHETSLIQAGRGVYTRDRLGSMTQERRERFFIERHDGFHVTPEIRKFVVFTPHNVIRDAPFTRLDLVSCRNLLIYFTPATQQRALSLFHFGLKSGGALCLGMSETLGDLRTEFQPIDESLRLYRKCREISPKISVGGGSISATAAPTFAVQSKDRVGKLQLLKTYDRLLERFSRPAILIDQQKKEVLHVFGGAGRYMVISDGRPESNVLNVVHPDLRAPLSLALIHLRKEGRPVTVEDIQCKIGDETLCIQITIEPFDQEDVGSSAIILFSQQEQVPVEPAICKLSAADVNAVEHLERELQFTQSNLQSTIEEFQTTNEELQSTNEQLTASNEELQSTNEELHSVNEELYTVNAEHQRKIDELTELNDDIDNLLTTTNVHTLFLDARLRLRRFTPRIAELFNLIPQDIGRPIDAFTHKLRDAKFSESIREVIRTEKPIHREIKDDNGQWYLLRIFPYLSRGTVEGAVVTLVDVTMLQAATEALQKSEERFDLAVRGSNAGIWDWQDVNEEFIWCSDRMYALLGRTLDQDMTISDWKDLIHPDDHDRVMDALSDHLEHDAPFDIEYRMEFGDQQEYRWFHMRGAAERLDGGRALRMAGSFEDVTSRREAEQEVKLGVARRDQFLAMLSHELRNPLGAVTNAVAVIATGEEPGRALGVVERQLAQMSRLLDDLLDVSRITHGKIELRKQETNLREIIERAVSAVQMQAESANLTLQTELDSDAVILNGDPARLEQVTVNLLNNAIKYTPSGGDVRLLLRVEGSTAVLKVRDSGVGIPADKLDEIFSLFYQSDETLDRSNGGMGVGLTLVKAVVELHDGWVQARSDGAGKGSEFTVSLPLSRAPAAPDVPSKLPTAQELRSIVLVEDIDDAREMLATLLTLRGFDVHEARDGAEGLETIRQLQPDAAIIDIGLPKMDGHEVARHVRSDPAHASVRLVALTGYGQDQDRRAVQESGFDLHLVKPLQPDQLDRILADLMRIVPQQRETGALE